MLSGSFKMILRNRRAWNVQRLYWLLWRDPRTSHAGTCSFCASAGLLRYDRTPKPAYGAFRSFTAETTLPRVSITAGPAQGSFTRDSTPRFSFGSNEAGSTFACRVDARPLSSVARPTRSRGSRTAPTPSRSRRSTPPGTRARSSRGPSGSTPTPPPAPQITDTDPDSPADDNAPELKGSAAAGSTVRLFKTAACTAGTAVAQGTAAKFASPGITALVADNKTTAFRARAVDAAGNISPCSGAFYYVEDSTP